jgi:hypothetical protein
MVGDPVGDEGNAGQGAEDGTEGRVAVVDQEQHGRVSFRGDRLSGSFMA